MCCVVWLLCKPVCCVVWLSACQCVVLCGCVHACVLCCVVVCMPVCCVVWLSACLCVVVVCAWMCGIMVWM